MKIAYYVKLKGLAQNIYHAYHGILKQITCVS